MKKKNIKKTKNSQPVIKEIKIDCGVMDNAGPSDYINIPKNKK